MTSIHAEVNCLKNIKFRKKYRLLVLKFNKQGELRDSKPCSQCKEYIKKKGFKEVYYSTNEGTIEKSKIDDMETIESKAQKRFKHRSFS